MEGGWSERLRRGFAYVATRPALRRLLGAQAAAFVFFALVIPIEVVFAKQALGTGDAGYGALLASWGAGMVARQPRVRRTARGARCACCCSARLSRSAPPIWGPRPRRRSSSPACVSVVGGIGNGAQWIALVTAVQELTRATYQARVLALLEALASAMPGVGFLLGGAITALFGPRASYALAGAGVLAVVAAAAAALRRVDWAPELEQGASRDDASSAASKETVPSRSTAGAGLDPRENEELSSG